MPSEAPDLRASIPKTLLPRKPVGLMVTPLCEPQLPLHALAASECRRCSGAPGTGEKANAIRRSTVSARRRCPARWVSDARRDDKGGANQVRPICSAARA
jgi:hypothetical protein